MPAQRWDDAGLRSLLSRGRRAVADAADAPALWARYCLDGCVCASRCGLRGMDITSRFRMCADAAAREASFIRFVTRAATEQKRSRGCARIRHRNGRIGMYGFSYQGATQLLAAAEQPEGLQCIAPHMTAADLYHGWFYHHGALRLSSSLGWGIQMLREDARRQGLRAASDRLEAAWANIRAQAAHVPYGAASGDCRSRVAGLCARLVCASRAGRVLERRRTSARGIDRIQMFRRCILRAGSTRILKARSRATSRCASGRAASLRARINT